MGEEKKKDSTLSKIDTSGDLESTAFRGKKGKLLRSIWMGKGKHGSVSRMQGSQ